MRGQIALLCASLAANVVLASALAWKWSATPRPLPLEASGWMHEPAPDVFARLPSGEGATVFLGDSLTAEGPWGELFGPWLNRGLKGDTTAGIRTRMGEVVDRRPGRIFLMAGINDLIRGAEPAQVAEEVEAIARAVAERSPASRLFVLSLLPIDERGLGGEPTNEVIRSTNELLRAVAGRRGLTFLNLHGPFAGADGRIRPELTSDGLHLTPAGYVLWRDALAPHVR